MKYVCANNTHRSNKPVYPGVGAVESIKDHQLLALTEEPDFLGNAPNYDKFAGWEPERVLAWLNID